MKVQGYACDICQRQLVVVSPKPLQFDDGFSIEMSIVQTCRLSREVFESAKAHICNTCAKSISEEYLRHADAQK